MRVIDAGGAGGAMEKKARSRISSGFAGSKGEVTDRVHYHRLVS
jgi:hypothetical protein